MLGLHTNFATFIFIKIVREIKLKVNDKHRHKNIDIK